MKLKKTFQYIGVLCLMSFSFYYTSEIAKIFNKEDTLMQQITQYASKNNIECIEGYITEEGVVLGISGLIVNEQESYYMMSSSGFDESLIQYSESSCVVSKKNNMSDYIIGGNLSKKSLSLIINVKTGKNIEKIINTSETKNVNLSLMVDYTYFNNNINYIKKLINNKYDLLYKGNTTKELLIMKEELNNNLHCIYNGNDKTKDICSQNNINTIRSFKHYTKDYLSNVKNNVKDGDFIILDESVELSNEISVIINYIKSRGLNIITISSHLE